jgi:hypothetical protein
MTHFAETQGNQVGNEVVGAVKDYESEDRSVSAAQRGSARPCL